MIKTFVNILVLITIILIAYFMAVNKKQIDQPDWENPGVFNINREDPKAHFFHYESEDLVLSAVSYTHLRAH